MMLLPLTISYGLATRTYGGSGVDTAPPPMCNPHAAKPQLCPGGIKCPQCGQPACPCPSDPTPPAPAPPPTPAPPRPPAPTPGGGGSLFSACKTESDCGKLPGLYSCIALPTDASESSFCVPKTVAPGTPDPCSGKGQSCCSDHDCRGLPGKAPQMGTCDARKSCG
eukprot:COSAG01_NODE_175_length_22996_cov_18.857892_23_plen_166_part_00